MVGSDAYIKGKYVEIGLNGLGGFEGVDTTISSPLSGMHHRSDSGGEDLFGFVANPQKNNWATFDGDFYTPGSPENGWGFEIDTSGGVKAGNNCAFLQQINGAITSWNYTTPYYSSDWEGDYTTGTNLHFRINTLLDENALFYTTTVYITNNTGSVIPELYYYRNIDPDNNKSIYPGGITGPGYMTINTIERQGGAGDTAQVSAVQNVPWTSYFSLAGLDTSWRASYGGFSNRDASNLYYGTTSVMGTLYTMPGSSDSMDCAISISRKISNFLPSSTRMLRFATIFSRSEVDCAINALGTTQAPFPAVCISSAPFVLNGGQPAGGVYSGPGVVNDSIFDPSLSGAGTFNIVYTAPGIGGCAGNCSAPITVDLCTGFSRTDNGPVISVFPNPNSGKFNISFESAARSDYQLKVMNVVGQVVYSEDLHGQTGNYSRQLDLSGFGKGVYTLLLSSGENEVVKKIIVY
jgi:hypothetical protein